MSFQSTRAYQHEVIPEVILKLDINIKLENILIEWDQPLISKVIR